MRALRLAMLLCMALVCGTAIAQAGPYSIGDRPSEIVGREIWSDKVISTEDFRGKWLLVDFFATWCGPCVHELPNLVAETRDLRGEKFEVLAVSVDFPTTHDKLKPMLREHGADYPCIYQGGGWQTPPVKAWGVNGIPAIFLLNPQGVIVATGLRGDKLRPALEYFLEHGESVPPMTLAVTPADTEDSAELALHFDVINPLRTPLELRVDAVQYVPEFAEDDPEKQGRPLRYNEVSSNPDGVDHEYAVDCSDWGFGGHYLLIDLDPDGFYLSVEYSVKMPGSETADNPDGVWLGGDYFTQLPALKALQEKQRAEREAAAAEAEE